MLPIFDGATEDEVAHELTAANPSDQPGYLHDGLTGDRFDQPVTVGVIYMLKLGHLTTRCTPVPSGRTLLITQQPLGGKAQFRPALRRDGGVGLRPSVLPTCSRKS
jgi:DNA-directed RNA polymerase subunit beta